MRGIFLRGVRVAAQTVVLAAVVAGTLAYVRDGRNVTLVVDGASTTLFTRAADVGGLLVDAGIGVTARDLVAPGPGTAVQAGQHVVVRFARPLTLTVDGVPRRYWTTELTVSAALEGLGIRAEGARLSASRSQPLGRSGLDVVMSTPKPVIVVGDGRTRRLTTTAPTVSDLLAEVGLAPRGQDRLSVRPTDPVVAGLRVALVRIGYGRLSITEPVPAPVIRVPARHLSVGTEHLLRPGRPGRRSAVYRVSYADGRETGRSLVSAVISLAPRARTVQVGSRPTARPSGSAPRQVADPGVDGLNWTALARCESGGNPRAVNPAGYYGLYQFSRGTWRALGGAGLPSDASAGEQLARAKLLFRRSGAGPWGCGRRLYD